MIRIKRNTNGDTRVATHVPTVEEFDDSNHSHVNDVKNIMNDMSLHIKNIGEEHDWSKLVEPLKSQFYRDLCNTIEGRMDFSDGKWSKYHYSTERHHLLRNVPEDVNLFDVLEMIADCVAAGLARSGDVRPLEIDNSVLVDAMNNTVTLVKSWCEIEGSDEE